MKYLIVVDMQVDFVSGALGSKEAQAIVGPVAEKIRSFDGQIIFTRDMHEENYLMTQEGKNLPVPHCIRGTGGWQIIDELLPFVHTVVDKPSFGSPRLAELLSEENRKEAIESIELIGLCTDICVISNAMLIKAALPEVPMTVDASCCAGVTAQSHKNTLEAMKMCQIAIKNEA